MGSNQYLAGRLYGLCVCVFLWREHPKAHRKWFYGEAGIVKRYGSSNYECAHAKK